MKPNKTEDWIQIANKFYERTNFPNIIGAMDRKHIHIVQPSGTGSTYFNYKKFFSLVLMAWVDSDYSFLFVDIGGYGTSADATIFEYSAMGRRLAANTLCIPHARPLPNDECGP
jgi:DNA segregation ATPase FtsK/SpoIIIE-like protein